MKKLAYCFSSILVMILLGYVWLFILSQWHPHEIDFEGLSKTQVIDVLISNLPKDKKNITIGVDGAWRHYNSVEEILSDPLLLNSNVWDLNEGERLNRFFCYHQTLFFEEGKVVRQELKVYTDSF